MPKLVDYMQEAPLESETVAVAELLQCIMMATLTVWLHECPHAVRAFLSNPMNFPQIVDLITDKATAMAGGGADRAGLVQGLASAVVGMCLVHYGDDKDHVGAAGAAQGSSSSTDVMTALDVMTSRVGLTRYLKKFEALFGDSIRSADDDGGCPGATYASLHSRLEAPLTSDTSPENALFPMPIVDAQLLRILEDLRSGLNTRVVSLFSKPHADGDTSAAGGGGDGSADQVKEFDAQSDPKAQYEGLSSLLQQCQAELRDLRIRNKILAEEVTASGSSSARQDQQRPSQSPLAPPGAPADARGGPEGSVGPTTSDCNGNERSEAQIKAITRASEAEAEAERARRAEQAGTWSQLFSLLTYDMRGCWTVLSSAGGHPPERCPPFGRFVRPQFGLVWRHRQEHTWLIFCGLLSSRSRCCRALCPIIRGAPSSASSGLKVLQ